MAEPIGQPLHEPIELKFGVNAFAPQPGEDLDQDCMDDRAENSLAQVFRPYFVFDSRENALLPGEPVIVYQVHPQLSHSEGCRIPKTVAITYTYLFRDDGGYATSFFCGDRHKGDNQSSEVDLEVDPSGSVFALSAVITGGFQWPRDPVRFYRGSHPVIYLSAGKHHEYIDTSYDGKAALYSNWGCREGMDGLGRQVLAQLRSAAAPTGWNNVGEPWAHPESAFVNSLAAFGFAGEDAWSASPYCGGQGPECGNETSSMASMWMGQ